MWWNNNVFGHVELKDEDTVKELNRLDNNSTIPDSGFLGMMHVDREAAVKKVWDSIHYKKSIQRQKARIRWIKDGDLNTRFFHNVIKVRERRNYIASALSQGGITLEGMEEIKLEVKSFSEAKFQEQVIQRPVLDEVEFKILNIEDRDRLEANFTIEEIKDVIWNCDGKGAQDQTDIIFLSLKGVGTLLGETS
ncbi:uncharacterized protein LOC131613777 [Vicia villosa]|uniref:uncharacterized protein LOC131613777 n=1 Tax=Vicia villosa TaxID=3911 RepID=UPI00273CC0A2|nr:uncharacterized protein LOC131613777 [Vicia villosa]